MCNFEFVFHCIESYINNHQVDAVSNWIDLFYEHIFLCFSLESTKITLAPSNADVKVSENVWMQCAASHDPSLDITFIWSLDGRVIDLHQDSLHYERTPVRHCIGQFFF